MGGSSPEGPRVGVVTGATSGIGREVAAGLAARGWRTVVIGRGPGRADRAAGEIAAASGNPAVESIEVADLAVRAEVLRLAQTLRDRYPQIHLLVNNAGGVFARREETSDGLERTFALNVMAPYLLTESLAARLRESAPSRVVMVSSAAHRGARFLADDLQSRNAYSGFRTYGRSKLELLLLTRALAEQFGTTGVTVNAVHPGFVASGFAQNNRGGLAIAVRLTGAVFGRSPKSGAQPILRLATDPSLAATTGQYFSRDRPASGSVASRDRASANRLVAALAALTASVATA